MSANDMKEIVRVELKFRSANEAECNFYGKGWIVTDDSMTILADYEKTGVPVFEKLPSGWTPKNNLTVEMYVQGSRYRGEKPEIARCSTEDTWVCTKAMKWNSIRNLDTEKDLTALMVDPNNILSEDMVHAIVNTLYGFRTEILRRDARIRVSEMTEEEKNLLFQALSDAK